MKFASFASPSLAAAGVLALAGTLVGCGDGAPGVSLSTLASVATPAALTTVASAQPAEEPVILASVTETSTTEGAPPTKSSGDSSDLTGQFILDGEVPAPDEADNTKEPLCGKKVLTDELVINQENKGIANIYVFIPAIKKPTVHPDLAASKEKNVVLDQEKCRFLPHSQVMRTDQVLLVKSMDEFNHNTRPNPIKNNPENFTVPPKERTGLPWKVKVAESLPTQIKCDIHPWMSAYVLVLDHPYAAVTDKDGKFKIEKLPAGELEFRYWHERPGYVEKSVKIKIEPGKSKDLGQIKVPLAKFAKQN